MSRLALLLAALLPLVLAMKKIKNPKSPRFQDVTAAVGIFPPKPTLRKYGGPTVVDLDSDGYPDLMFVHHDKTFAEVYFNQKNGKFIKSPWQLWTDMHAIVACPESVWSRRKVFTVSSGGNFGKDPTPPRMFLVDGRSIREITQQAGVDKDGGRGRSTLYMHMKKNFNFRNPDLMVTNAHSDNPAQPSHFAYYNNGPSGSSPPTYQLRRLPNYQFNKNTFAMAADIDGDGEMEMISYQSLTFYKLTAPFGFQDVTSRVLPPGIDRHGVQGIAEFDFDNDGDMDLYIARTNTGDLQWLTSQAGRPANTFNDLLLENRGGMFVEIGKSAGIPQNSLSRGVTVGDFNNDGFMDVFVSQYTGSDVMLLNKGDGTFKWVNGLVNRPGDVRGDNAQAVDYDLDGRVDLIVSQGDWINSGLGGDFKVLRSVGKKRAYLLVRVGAAPDRTATSLHALVTVKTPTGMIMTRRVGSVGDGTARSMVETVHFGMRGWKKADWVKVEWLSGKTVTKTNVKSRTMVSFGFV